MKPSSRIVRNILLAAIIVAAVCLVGGYIVLARGIVMHTESTITWLDPQARLVSIAFVHPRKGIRIEPRIDIPSGCPITLDDQAASLVDLRPGDQARIAARVTHLYSKAKRTFTIIDVDAERTADSLSDLPGGNITSVIASKITSPASSPME